MRLPLRGFACALSLTMLACLLLACGGAKPPVNPIDSTSSTVKDKGDGTTAATPPSDLKLTTLDVDGKSVLPCMMWTDNTGSAFFVADGDQATLHRFSGADYKTKQTTNLGVKPAWLSLSAEGLVLTVTDKNEIRVLDPNDPSTVKKTIALAQLKRAVSVPSLSIAVASTGTFKQELALVDLKTGAVTPIAPPRVLGNLGYGEEVMMSPDGQNVYTNDLSGTLVRWSLTGKTLTYAEKGPRMHAGTAYAITVSGDTKYVAQPCAAGNGDAGKSYATLILSATAISQRQCVLEIGTHPRPLGFDVANGVIYTGSDKGLLAFDLGSGVKKKEYDKFGKGDALQFLVHPAGKKFIELQAEAGRSGSLTYVEVKN